jgi:NADH-quinone oxidoreductase subunit J
MEFKSFLFYFFSLILVFAGLRVVTARNPVHSAMFLVLSFFTAACIWILLEAEFLAITLVLVYIGAVMVLFLFVVMMLDINLDRLREGFWRWFPVGALVAAIMVVEMVLVLWQPFGEAHMPPPEPQAAEYSNTKALGRLIYTEYVYPFEIAAVILLVAIVAAIALTLRRRPGTKHQDPARQVVVRRRDRVRLVSLPAEKAGD